MITLSLKMQPIDFVQLQGDRNEHKALIEFGMLIFSLPAQSCLVVVDITKPRIEGLVYPIEEGGPRPCEFIEPDEAGKEETVQRFFDLYMQQMIEFVDGTEQERRMIGF